MAKVLDVILIVIGFGVYAALSLYKLILLYRFRNDPAKREALVWTTQVYPKRLTRFILDEDADMSARKASASKSGRK